jgi:hypothetical protein
MCNAPSFGSIAPYVELFAIYFGNVKYDVSFRTVGQKQCLRCPRITDHKTVRRRVTFGEVERRLAANPPKGYSFV